VPAYLVLHDSVIEALCRRLPSNVSELLEVQGIGERKAEQYGVEILQALRNYESGARAQQVAKEHTPAEQTLQLIKEGKSFEEIAQIRVRQHETIISTVASLIETGQLKLRPEWVSPSAQQQIEAVCQRVGTARLKAIKDALPASITFDDIRLVVAHLRTQQVLDTEST
jgi:ATP-dependent DNA helicase RecQ